MIGDMAAWQRARQLTPRQCVSVCSEVIPLINNTCVIVCLHDREVIPLIKNTCVIVCLHDREQTKSVFAGFDHELHSHKVNLL